MSDDASKTTRDGFPKPRQNPGGEPCGECHLKSGETCDICGAVSKTTAKPCRDCGGRGYTESLTGMYLRCVCTYDEEIASQTTTELQRLAQAKSELELAQRRGDLQRASELIYGVIPDIERQLKEVTDAD